MVFAVSAYHFSEDSKESNSQLVSSMNLQMRKSFNSYLSKLENTSKIFFSKKDYISYDITRQKNDYSNNIRKEKEIEDYLVSLSLMDNYADFGLVYRNNHTIGKITDGMMDIYEGNMFYALSEYLGSDMTKWVTGYNNDYTRFMYLRKANDNAIFVASFYSTDLENVFPTEKQSGKVKFLLSDNQNRIIYSENEKELGKKLSDNKIEMIDGNKDCIVITNDYITSISSCGSDWKLSTILNLERQHDNLRRNAIISISITLFNLIIFHLVGFIITTGKNPELAIKSTPRHSDDKDVLTGLLNAEATENEIADKIETCITGSTIMFALISISNYSLIVDNYGEQTANEAIIKVKNVLTDMYGENNIIGRMDKNQFAVFADFTEYDLFKAHNNIKENLNILEKNMAKCELDNNRGVIKTAVGAVIYPDNSDDYDELYAQALEALDMALENGSKKAVLIKNETDEKGRCKS